MHRKSRYAGGVDRLNYHHLHYFWTVAKEGSVAGACRVLHVSQPTVSGQVRLLEESIGQRLFEKQGRGLALTEVGRVVFRYADDMFSIGEELRQAVRGRTSPARAVVRVGVADALPKLVVCRMLAPAFEMPGRVRIACFEGKFNELLARLAVHELDVVIGDAPVAASSGFRAFSHKLGESAIGAFAAAGLATGLRKGFPASLDGAPILLPTPNTLVRRRLDHWLGTLGIAPEIVGEFEDSALLKVFGQSGRGVFFAPMTIEREVRRQYDVRLVGRVADVREEFYAVTVERRIVHPAVAHIAACARKRLE